MCHREVQPMTSHLDGWVIRCPHCAALLERGTLRLDGHTSSTLAEKAALEPRVKSSLCIRCARAGEGCPIYPPGDPVLECKEFVA